MHRDGLIVWVAAILCILAILIGNNSLIQKSGPFIEKPITITLSDNKLFGQLTFSTSDISYINTKFLALPQETFYGKIITVYSDGYRPENTGEAQYLAVFNASNVKWHRIITENASIYRDGSFVTLKARKLSDNVLYVKSNVASVISTSNSTKNPIGSAVAVVSDGATTTTSSSTTTTTTTSTTISTTGNTTINSNTTTTDTASLICRGTIDSSITCASWNNMPEICIQIKGCNPGSVSTTSPSVIGITGNAVAIITPCTGTINRSRYMTTCSQILLSNCSQVKGCYLVSPGCGNNYFDVGEQCEILNGQVAYNNAADCRSFGYDRGSLKCKNDCTIDKSGCYYSCSDGTRTNSCSNTEGKYCNANKQLINECVRCGCFAGKGCYYNDRKCYTEVNATCTGDTSVPSVYANPYIIPATTKYITPYANCSVQQPYRCQNGRGFLNSTVCGCPGESKPLKSLTDSFNIKQWPFSAESCAREDSGAFYLNCDDGTVEAICSSKNPGFRCQRKYDVENDEIRDSILVRDARCGSTLPRCRDSQFTEIGVCSLDPNYLGTKCTLVNGQAQLIDNCTACGNKCANNLICNSLNGFCYNPTDATKPILGLDYPETNANILTNTNVSFICDVSDNIRIKQAELGIQKTSEITVSRQYTPISGSSVKAIFTKKFNTTGNYMWGCGATDTNNNTIMSTPQRLFSVTEKQVCKNGFGSEVEIGNCDLSSENKCELKNGVPTLIPRCGECNCKGFDTVCSKYNGKCVLDSDHSESSGDKKILTIVFKYNDSAAVPTSNYDIAKMIYNRLNDYYINMSNGNLWITNINEYAIDKSEDVFVLRDPVENVFCCDIKSVSSIIIQKVLDQEGYGFYDKLKNADYIILISAQGATVNTQYSGQAIFGRQIYGPLHYGADTFNISTSLMQIVQMPYPNSDKAFFQFVHEFGHTLRIAHAYATYCPTLDFDIVGGTVECILSSGTHVNNTYRTHAINPMGYLLLNDWLKDDSTYLSNAQRRKFNWTNVTTIRSFNDPYGSAPGTFRIYPLENTSVNRITGLKFFHGQKGSVYNADAQPTYFYTYIEFARYIGYDKFLNDLNVNIDGALIYVSNDDWIKAGDIYIDTTPHGYSTESFRYDDFKDVVLQKGNIWRDPVSGYSVEVVDVTNDYIDVTISDR